MPDVLDLSKLSQTPEDKAFEQFVEHKLTEPYKSDQRFVELLRIFFVAGWEACYDYEDRLGDDT